MKEKIFLIFNTACFGDVLICNTLCQNIKRLYPEARVVFIVDKPFYDAAKYQKDVDEVVIYDKKAEHRGLKGFIKFIINFKYKNAYAAFITYSNIRNVFISILSGAKNIFYKNKFNKTTPVQEQVLYLLHKISKSELKNVPIKYYAPDLPQKLESIFTENKQYVVLCTLSKKTTKDMPIDTAIEIINKLSSDYRIIYTGIGEDAVKYAKNLEQANCSFINLVNQTTIAELASLLKRCHALISIDTGTMHLGTAVGIPVIAVFYEHDFLHKWLPDSNLYNIVPIINEQTADNICNALKKQIGYGND